MLTNQSPCHKTINPPQKDVQMNILPEKFRSPHKTLGVCETEPVLVALSGGADSTALLYMMCVCREASNFRLCAAHINHNIRTAEYNNEALRDESFCRELCDKLGVELFVLNADIPSLASQRGESTETVARRVRYDFFSKIMREQNIKILLTAHNSDDNLETQIFNLCRGCGTQGISGIPPVRDFPEGDGIIFRPLLSITKKDILKYCAHNSIEFVTDSTNFENEYTRNRIRSKIIPELVDIFGNPQAASQRLAAAATEDADYISSQAEAVYNSFENGQIPLSIFNSLHIALKRRILCMGFATVSSASLETVHLNALIELAQKATPHSSISLPDKISAKIEQNCIVFEREKETSKSSYHIKLELGINKIDGTDFLVLVSEEDKNQVLNFDGQIYKLYTFARIKDATMLSLFARSRREGDTIYCNGMTKKVKKLLCDNKVPLSDRDSLPIITQKNEIIYLPLCAVCDRVHAKENSQFGIYIYKAERTVQ